MSKPSFSAWDEPGDYFSLASFWPGRDKYFFSFGKHVYICVTMSSQGSETWSQQLIQGVNKKHRVTGHCFSSFRAEKGLKHLLSSIPQFILACYESMPQAISEKISLFIQFESTNEGEVFPVRVKYLLSSIIDKGANLEKKSQCRTSVKMNPFSCNMSKWTSKSIEGGAKRSTTSVTFYKMCLESMTVSKNVLY